MTTFTSPSIDNELSEVDIGLSSLPLTAEPSDIRPRPSARPSGYTRAPPAPLSLATTPTQQYAQLKSPSSPNLTKMLPPPSPTTPRRPSRSKTLSRLPSGSMHRTRLSLDGMIMGPDKVARLRKWILSLVTVNFDLEIGPKITSVYPPLGLSHTEAQNVAFSSFPDSSYFEEGSQTHSFRIRLREPGEEEQWDTEGPRPKTEDGFIYGFSCFTRTKDSSSKRGYQQTSIVILTHLAYPNLFYTLISKLAPSFMSYGGPMLEAACHNISSWSDPVPGTTIELGFLGTVIHAELPEAIETQQTMSTISPTRLNETDIQILVSICPAEPPILDHFESVISHLWSIWECVVLGEPMLVFGPSPAMSSAAVWWLRDLIRPIPLSGDFRPFFTIHDADHTALVNPRAPWSGLLLGVTNPFFERACKHWPHVLSLGSAHMTATLKTPIARTPTLKLSAPSPGIIVGPPPGWKSTHKRYTSRDHALMQQLEHACRSSEYARREASEALRRHFTSRTTALLVPLQRYFQSLIPTPSESRSNLHAPARLKPFQEAAFLASLKAHGSPLPFKSSTKRREFYERWLRTPAHVRWLAKQDEAAQGVLKKDYSIAR